MKFFVNFLSAFRIAASFAMIPLLILSYESWLPFIVFTVAAITDFFDGWLARKYNVTTKIGGVMDHIGDKLLVIITMIMIIPMMPTWTVLVPIAMMVARELYISGLREFMGTQKMEMPVSKPRFSMAKIKTTLQMVALPVFLLVGPTINLFVTPEMDNVFLQNLPFGLLILSIALLWLSMVASLWSAGEYTKTFAKLLKKIK